MLRAPRREQVWRNEHRSGATEHAPTARRDSTKRTRPAVDSNAAHRAARAPRNGCASPSHSDIIACAVWTMRTRMRVPLWRKKGEPRQKKPLPSQLTDSALGCATGLANRSHLPTSPPPASSSMVDAQSLTRRYVSAATAPPRGAPQGARQDTSAQRTPPTCLVWCLAVAPQRALMSADVRRRAATREETERCAVVVVDLICASHTYASGTALWLTTETLAGNEQLLA